MLDFQFCYFYGIYFVDHDGEVSQDGHREGSDKHIHAEVFTHTQVL